MGKKLGVKWVNGDLRQADRGSVADDQFPSAQHAGRLNGSQRE